MVRLSGVSGRSSTFAIASCQGLAASFGAIERRQVKAELQLAEAELAVIQAELEGAIDAEPPF